jgi:dolichyl-phosphate-mannose-protein mannosyltransferase
MPPQPTEPLAIRAPAFSRRERVLLAVVLLVGIALRLVAFSRAAVEHFDEGVYASNIYFGPPDYAYPQQRFFGPSLLPALIEAGMIAGLPANVAALLPSFIAGCATIVALWWFGRSWFGTEAGLAAAALLALSNFHIAFTTTALTDVLLGLWLVLAIDAIARSLAGTDYRWAIGAGIYTGLAWWTKYNGWLPLAIEATTLPFLWILVRPPRKILVHWLGCFAVTGLVAAVVWTPYYLSLESQGGYAPIAANHARYLVGLSGWLDAARRQAAALATLESPLDKASFVVAITAAVLARRTGARRWASIAWSVLVALAAIVLTNVVLIAIIATVRLSGWVLSLGPRRRSDNPANPRVFAASLLCVWFGGLFFTVPLYTPYLRLMLPWFLAICLAAGWGAESVANFHNFRELFQKSPWRRVALFAVVALAGIIVALLKPGRPSWQLGTSEIGNDRTGVLKLAREIEARLGHEQSRVIYVYGEPAMFFQLRAAGEQFVAPVADVPDQAVSKDGTPAATYFITGPHSKTDPHFQQQWAAVETHWEQLQSFDFNPSPIVWLDLHDPRRRAEAPTHHSFQLYRWRSE